MSRRLYTSAVTMFGKLNAWVAKAERQKPQSLQEQLGRVLAEIDRLAEMLLGVIPGLFRGYSGDANLISETRLLTRFRG